MKYTYTMEYKENKLYKERKIAQHSVFNKWEIRTFKGPYPLCGVVTWGKLSLGATQGVQSTQGTECPLHDVHTFTHTTRSPVVITCRKQTSNHKQSHLTALLPCSPTHNNTHLLSQQLCQSVKFTGVKQNTVTRKKQSQLYSPSKLHQTMIETNQNVSFVMGRGLLTF